MCIIYDSLKTLKNVKKLYVFIIIIIIKIIFPINKILYIKIIISHFI